MNFPLLLIECIGIAFGAGLVYGIFGGGSGLIMAPGYYYLIQHFSLNPNYRMQMAIATTAAASAVVGLFSARVQWKKHNVDFSVIKKMIPGLAIGTFTAVLLLNVIPSDFLKHLFGVVVVLVSIWLWFYKQEKDLKQWSLNGFNNHIRTFLIGVLWFLLGIALFTVPYLHKASISIRRAIGAASFLGSIFSALAALLLMITGYPKLHASIMHVGYVNVLLFLISLIPSICAGIIGSKLSHYFPQHHLKTAYAILVCLVGIMMLI